MSNLLQRLLLFFVVLPLLIALFFFLPGWHHAAAITVIILFSVGCSIELAGIFSARGVAVSKAAFASIGGVFPLAAFLGTWTQDAAIQATSLDLICILTGIGIAAVFTPFAFSTASSIPGILSRASAYTLAIGYIGVLSAFVTLITSEPPFGTESLFSFLLIVLSTDTLAWFFGNVLGKRRGIVAVSPNKSVAGFVGGIAGALGAAHLAGLLFPEALSTGIAEISILGLTVGAAAIVGDLVESGLKRSAGIKDSGTLIPGRGGFLDTMDSLLFAAPFFYGLSRLFGLFA